MRRHGLEWPLDPHQVSTPPSLNSIMPTRPINHYYFIPCMQIGSFFLFAFLVIGCYVLQFPFIDPPAAKYVLVTLYTIAVCVTFFLAYITSSSDPSDPAVHTHASNTGEFFCHFCKAGVNKSSKHCKTCDRCVLGFDHHCKWLNNCIGSLNYRQFFALLAVTITMLTIQLIWAIYDIVRSFTSKDLVSMNASNTYGSSFSYPGWQAALFIYALLLGATVVMLGELFIFHIVLISKDMTTYDYIVAQSRPAGQAAASSTGGAREALCRSNQVADTAGQPKPRVGINPCRAISTQKPEGTPQEWEAQKKQREQMTNNELALSFKPGPVSEARTSNWQSRRQPISYASTSYQAAGLQSPQQLKMPLAAAQQPWSSPSYSPYNRNSGAQPSLSPFFFSQSSPNGIGRGGIKLDPLWHPASQSYIP